MVNVRNWKVIWEGKVCEGRGKLGVGIEKMGMKELIRLLSCITNPFIFL